MHNCVLDASALLALINDETGAEVVASLLSDAAISSVNFGEVVAKLMDHGWTEAEIREDLNSLGLNVIGFDQELAYRAGVLRSQTKSLGLSFGDRACLALAEQLELPVFTSDRIWANLTLSVVIRVIR